MKKVLRGQDRREAVKHLKTMREELAEARETVQDLKNSIESLKDELEEEEE